MQHHATSRLMPADLASDHAWKCWERPAQLDVAWIRTSLPFPREESDPGGTVPSSHTAVERTVEQATPRGSPWRPETRWAAASCIPNNAGSVSCHFRPTNWLLTCPWSFRSILVCELLLLLGNHPTMVGLPILAASPKACWTKHVVVTETRAQSGVFYTTRWAELNFKLFILRPHIWGFQSGLGMELTDKLMVSLVSPIPCNYFKCIFSMNKGHHRIQSWWHRHLHYCCDWLPRGVGSINSRKMGREIMPCFCSFIFRIHDIHNI